MVLEQLRNSRGRPKDAYNGPIVLRRQDQMPPDDYENYRKRKLWKTIRDRVFERDRRKCRRCYGPAEVVHHRSYAPEVMEGNADEWLVSLCHGCHTVVEFEDSNVRRLWPEKERVLWTPDMQIDFPEPVIDLRRWQIGYALRPKGWERMNINQKNGWERRRDELVAERRKKSRRLTTHYFPSRKAAEAEAYRVLDAHPLLRGRFRDRGADQGTILYLAMLSLGRKLYENSAHIVPITPKAAKKLFDSFLQQRAGRDFLTEHERELLDKSAVWKKSRGAPERRNISDNQTPTN